MFEDRFVQVVLEPARQDLAFTNFPFTKHCGNAHGPFDTTTSVLCYCLCYQHTHFESLTAIIRSGAFDQLQQPLIIDVGAGPATVPLALAQHYVTDLRRDPLALHYVDVERSPEMRAIAGRFLNDATLFRDVHRVSLADLTDMARAQELGPLINGSDGVIFSMSFILRQPFVDTALAEYIASLVIALARDSGLPTFVLSQEQSGGAYDRVNAFFNRFSTNGYRIEGGYGRRMTQPHRQMLLDGRIPHQATHSLDNVSFAAGRVIPL